MTPELLAAAITGFWFGAGAAGGIMAGAGALWAVREIRAQAHGARCWLRDRAQTREFMNRATPMPGWQRAHQTKVRAEHGLPPLRIPGGE